MGDQVKLRPVLYIVGILLTILASSMVLPAFADIVIGDREWRVFAFSATATGYIGVLLIFTNRGYVVSLNRPQAFLLTTAAWLTISAFGALPFLLLDLKLTYTDAFFEAISGLTTTGSTILSGLDTMPPGILLWRGILQWLGGIGIIAMAIAVLPFLRVGGMQLFRLESSDKSNKIMPRPMQIARSIGLIYVGLTVACAILYAAAGMTGFDAVVHAMTTLSTGGYANFDASLGYYRQPVIEWIGIAFMILGSLPFVLYIRFLRGDRTALWRDPQVRGFLTLLLYAVGTLSVWLWLKGHFPPLEALRVVAFNVVSIVTTTGFVSSDYEQWIQGTEMLFLLLTVIGGCTGSTAGAIKLFRLQIMKLVVGKVLFRLIYPHAVVQLNYGGRPVTFDVAVSVVSFMFVFVASAGLLTLSLSALGLDFLTSLSAAMTAISNVGPGLGKIIGPTGNFAALPDAAKWILSLGMLLGRLEFFSVLVLLMPRFWRD